MLRLVSSRESWGLLALGSSLCVLIVACVAPDPTVPVAPWGSMVADGAPPTLVVAATLTPAATTSQGGSERSQEDMIDLSPTATVSSIHADVGDHVFVQVNIPNRHGCTDLKVRDPFGNVIALAPKEIRSDEGDFVQFRGAFFAAAAGDYLVDLEIDSENLRCGGSAPRRAEVKWMVQPR